MHLVIRKYSGSGAVKLFDVLEKHSAELQTLMRPVQGLVSYTLARSGDGGFSVTVCQDKAGIDQSIQKAADWIAKNAPNTGAAKPEITLGNVVAHVK
jgi:hypothetical protein